MNKSTSNIADIAAQQFTQCVDGLVMRKVQDQLPDLKASGISLEGGALPAPKSPSSGVGIV